MSVLSYLGKEIKVLYDVDCCVVGGGTAGAAAAISASLSGAKTLVVEKGSALGGSQTLALVMPMMSTGVKDNDLKVNALIKKRLIEEGIDIDDKFGNTGWFNFEKLSLVLEELIIEHSGEILYDTTFIDSFVEQGHIKYIIVYNIDGLCAIKAKTFIDASGDAVLSKASGIKVKAGNEKTGKNQVSSLRFEMGGIDLEKLYAYMKEIGDNFSPLTLPFYEIAMIPGRCFALEGKFLEALKRGEINKEDMKYFQAFTVPGKKGVMAFNCPEIPNSDDTTSSINRSRYIIRGREMTERLANFLINYIPGFEDSYLIRNASMLGVRESYRIVGKYVLNEEDYKERRKFEDTVAKTRYYIDVHTDDEEPDTEMIEEGDYYTIPYRSLITNEIKNLIVAGRCISSTFLLQSSLRIQPTCRDTGEAAGKACAYSIKNSIPLNEIDWTKVI